MEGILYENINSLNLLSGLFILFAIIEYTFLIHNRNNIIYLIKKLNLFFDI